MAASKTSRASGKNGASTRETATTSAPAKRQTGRATAKTAAGASRSRGSSRREDIIRAAAETFYKNGYDATTTQDIAEAVGMLKGSLYYYIAAKEDLLYEIIEEVHAVWAKNLQRHKVLDGAPLTQIWAFVHDNVIGNAENLVKSAVFFRDFGALTGERRKRILALRDVHDNALRDLIREGQTAGQVRKDVDPKIAATGILTMCNALYHWYRADGSLSPQQVADSYADMAVASLARETELLAAARTQARAAMTALSATDVAEPAAV